MLETDVRENLKDATMAEKLKTHLEIVRRKLDFEVIKDNYENKVT